VIDLGLYRTEIFVAGKGEVIASSYVDCVLAQDARFPM
jgi:hypothetical protein